MNNSKRQNCYDDIEMRSSVKLVALDSVITNPKAQSIYSWDELKKGLLVIPAVAGLIALFYLIEQICWTIF